MLTGQLKVKLFGEMHPSPTMFLYYIPSFRVCQFFVDISMLGRILDSADFENCLFLSESIYLDNLTLNQLFPDVKSLIQNRFFF